MTEAVSSVGTADPPVNKEYSSSDYLSIKLIKQLIRQTNSRIHLVKKEEEQEQISRRGKMMLYQIVRN